MRRGLAAMAAIAMLAGASACSSASSSQLGDPPAIGGSDVEVSSSPSEVDQWAVPDVITEDYIRRVLTEIEREDALFWRWLLDSEPGEQPPADVAEHIHKVYVAVSSQQVIDQLLEQYEAADGELSGFADPYDQYYPEEIIIHRADPACPLIEVTWDASTAEPGNGPSSRVRAIYALLRPTNQPVNATGFVYSLIQPRTEVTDENLAEELEERTLCV